MLGADVYRSLRRTTEWSTENNAAVFAAGSDLENIMHEVISDFW